MGLAGRYKLGGRRSFEAALAPALRAERRVQRILESLRSQIVEGSEEQSLRIRRVFAQPREIYRLEIEVPELGYLRTTLLDRDALEELLAWDEVRARVRGCTAPGRPPVGVEPGAGLEPARPEARRF